MFRNTCITNIASLDDALKDHTHEEADTCIVFHALDITNRNPFTDLVICCSDTDVVLLLLHYFDELSTSTINRSTNYDIILRQAYDTLGPELCKSLLGFHALTGCDQTGKFSGFSKLSCWKVLIDSSPHVLNALQLLGSAETE